MLFLVAIAPSASAISLAYPDICSVATIETDVRVPIYLQALDPSLTVGGLSPSAYDMQIFESKAGKGFIYILTFKEVGKASLEDKVAKCSLGITVANIEASRSAQRAESRIKELSEENAKLKDRIENEMNPMKVQVAKLEEETVRQAKIIAENQTVTEPRFMDYQDYLLSYKKVGTLDLIQIRWGAFLFVVGAALSGLWLHRKRVLHARVGV